MRGVAVGLVALGLASCGAPSIERGELPPPERFNFGEQPIRLSPTPDDWRREKTTDGGWRGLRLVKSGSVGERILVAEAYRFDERDRCVELDDLLARCNELEWRSLSRELPKLRYDTRKPYTDREASLGNQINQALDRTLEAVRTGDNGAACRDLEIAREQAGWISIGLDDLDEEELVVFRVGPPIRPDQYRPGPRSTLEIAGKPAVRRDYVFTDRGNTFIGREVFVMHNNRLFVLAFHGLEEHLPIFDDMLASVVFPAGACEH
jgi:hypothetical protein